MKKVIIIALGLGLALNLSAQRFLTKTGHIYFSSDAPLEKIEAHNRQVNAALDSRTGDFIFKVLMKSFAFEKALMQEHFNENYVESDLYPNAIFVGKIPNLDDVDFEKAGTYQVTVMGDMNLHGKSQKIEEDGVLVVSKDGIQATSTFNLEIADYDISIPGAVAGKIADEIQIHVDVNLKALNK